MLVLFDNGTPRTLARYLIDHHAVTEARARGWDELENGALLNAAEAAGFDVLVTTDKNLSYQQNLSGRKIAIVVLGQGQWSLIKARVSEVVAHRRDRCRAWQLYAGGNSVRVGRLGREKTVRSGSTGSRRPNLGLWTA
jgi:hypothetical protein